MHACALSINSPGFLQVKQLPHPDGGFPVSVAQSSRSVAQKFDAVQHCVSIARHRHHLGIRQSSMRGLQPCRIAFSCLICCVVQPQMRHRAGPRSLRCNNRRVGRKKRPGKRCNRMPPCHQSGSSPKLRCSLVLNFYLQIPELQSEIWIKRRLRGTLTTT